MANIGRGYKLKDIEIETILDFIKAGYTDQQVAVLSGRSRASVNKVRQAGSVEEYRNKNNTQKPAPCRENSLAVNYQFNRMFDAINKLAKSIDDLTGFIKEDSRKRNDNQLVMIGYLRSCANKLNSLTEIWK